MSYQKLEKFDTAEEFDEMIELAFERFQGEVEKGKKKYGDTFTVTGLPSLAAHCLRKALKFQGEVEQEKGLANLDDTLDDLGAYVTLARAYVEMLK